MSFEIENKFNDGVFIIANIQTNIQKTKKVLQATTMAGLLTDINLPEHFEIDKKFIKKYDIVTAFKKEYYGHTIDQSQYYKKIYQIGKGNFVIKPSIDCFYTVIVQGIAFDRFFTDAFLVSNKLEADKKVNDYCNTAIILNKIFCKTIKQISQ